MRKAIALLGGAFNPVTRGHIQLAEYVLTAPGVVDEVWLMPCYAHAYAKRMAASVYRLQMCRLAVSGRGGLRVFEYEIEARATSGTYYLMKQLLADTRYAEQYTFSMIIGQDNANTFEHWIKYAELRDLIRFIVVPRRGVLVAPDVSWYHHSPHLYLSRDCRIMDVSSTQVRSLLSARQWEELSGLVDPVVLSYIREHGLYEQEEQPLSYRGH